MDEWTFRYEGMRDAVADQVEVFSVPITLTSGHAKKAAQLRRAKDYAIAECMDYTQDAHLLVTMTADGNQVGVTVWKIADGV